MNLRRKYFLVYLMIGWGILLFTACVSTIPSQSQTQALTGVSIDDCGIGNVDLDSHFLSRPRTIKDGYVDKQIIIASGSRVHRKK